MGEDTTMKRSIAVLICVCASVVAVIGAQALKGQGTSKQIPARFTTVRGASGDGILNDLKGDYLNGSNCVVSWVDSRSGYYFLRTTTFNCATANPRTMTLDFTNAINRTPDGSGSDSCHVNDAFGDSGELNICGSAAGPNTVIPDVRIIAGTMFSSTAVTQGTTVSIPFSLSPDFSGTDFELDYELPVAVGVNSSTSRTLNAYSTTACGPGVIADLYKYPKHGNKISLGRYCMPFQVTVQE
jgi:hypothetical protein